MWYIQWNIIQPWKEGYPAICDNMDGPWGHYATWDKSEKTNTIWSHLHVESLKKKPHRYREQIGSCQRQGEEGGWNA